MKNLNSGDCPVAFIAKNKQRLKQYNNVVYLKNGDEFQIELFNPTKEKVLAEITINNKSLSTGISLRPGERVFLERYTNESTKFKFETYTVDGNNVQVQKAIEDNGNVKVNFYKEGINWGGITWTWDSVDSSSSGYPIKYYTFLTNNNSSNGITGTCSNCVSTTYNSLSNNIPLNSGFGIRTNDNLNISSTVGSFNTSASTINKKEKSIETGVIGKGSKSEQKLVNDNSNFMYSPSWTNEWKILPESRREVTSDDLLIYCSCGRKQRKNEKFCPSCGKKFSLNETNIEIEKGDTVIIKNKNAISVVSDISLDGDGNKIYFVKYPMDDRWYKRNQIEFNHKN